MDRNRQPGVRIRADRGICNDQDARCREMFRHFGARLIGDFPDEIRRKFLLIGGVVELGVG